MREKDYYGAIKGFCLKWNLPEVWNSDRITGANLIYEVIKVINAMIVEQKATKEMIEEFIRMFDEDLSDTVKDRLTVWLNDGTLGDIINETLFNSKADKNYVDGELEDLDKEIKEVTTQLTHKENYVNFSDLLISGEVKKIKLIGDSITWGADADGYNTSGRGRFIYGSHYEMAYNVPAWANLFRNYLNTYYPNVDLFNAGISGFSMKNASQLKTQWIGTGNDVLFLNLGVNDFSSSESILKFEEYMEDVINYSLSNSNHLFISTTPPVVKDDNVGQNGHSIEMINASIRKMAHKHNVPLLDINNSAIEIANTKGVHFDIGGYFHDDLTHPSTKGHEVLWLAYQKELGFKAEQTAFMISNKQAPNKVIYAGYFPSDFNMDSTPYTQPTFYEDGVIYINVGINDVDRFSPTGTSGLLVIKYMNSKFDNPKGYLIQTFYSSSGTVLNRVFQSDETWSNWSNLSENTSIKEDIPLEVGWEKSGFTKTWVVKNNNICNLQIVATGEVTTTDNQKIGTLDPMYIPERTVFFNVYTDDGVARGFLRDNGDIYISNANVGTGKYIGINVSYPIN